MASPKLARDKSEEGAQVASKLTCERLRKLLNDQRNDDLKAAIIFIACGCYFFNAEDVEPLVREVTSRKTCIEVVSAMWMRITGNSVAIRQWAEAKFSEAEQKQIARNLGIVFYFHVELPSGHYILDLKDPKEYHIATTLQRLGNEEHAGRRGEAEEGTEEAEVEHGNWRNVVHKGKHKGNFNEWKIPREGRLVLDYVAMVRPPAGCEAIEEDLFKQLETQISTTIEKVGSLESQGDIWSHLKQTAPVKKRWGMATKKVFSAIKKAKGKEADSLTSTLTKLRANLKDATQLDTTYHFMVASVAANDLYFTSTQAANLISIFPEGQELAALMAEEGDGGQAKNFYKKLRPQKKGKSRICAAAFLHCRVLDGSLLSKLRQTFSAPELNELLHRVGWLGLFNPLEPEGEYVLDLGKKEQWEIANLFVQFEYDGNLQRGKILEHREPWIEDLKMNGSFFELPISWFYDGPPTFGKLDFTYNPKDKARVRDLAVQFLKSKCLLGKGDLSWLSALEQQAEQRVDAGEGGGQEEEEEEEAEEAEEEEEPVPSTIVPANLLRGFG